MLQGIRNLAKKSTICVIANLAYLNWIEKKRFQNGEIESMGGTHMTLKLDESIQYIEDVFNDYLRYGGVSLEDLKGKTILEIGPGNNYGVALKFLSHGAEKVVCIDKFHCIRDPENEKRLYQKIRESLSSECISRFDSVVKLESGLQFNSERLSRIVGTGIEDSKKLLPDQSFDFIISRAVLEHVYDPELTFIAMDRLLKPSGRMIHKIDFRDHGMFSQLGFHPLTFLTVSEKIYPYLVKDSGLPNRKLIDFYRDKMKDLPYDTQILVTELVGNFPITLHRAKVTLGADFEQKQLDLVQSIRSKLAAPFRKMSDIDLLIAGIFLIAEKRSGARTCR